MVELPSTMSESGGHTTSGQDSIEWQLPRPLFVDPETEGPNQAQIFDNTIIMRQILSFLDIDTLESFRLVNKDAHFLVSSDFRLRYILVAAPDIFHQVRWTRASWHVTMDQLSETLRSSDCHHCSQPGIYICLLDCTRCCEWCRQDVAHDLAYREETLWKHILQDLPSSIRRLCLPPITSKLTSDRREWSIVVKRKDVREFVCGWRISHRPSELYLDYHSKPQRLGSPGPPRYDGRFILCGFPEVSAAHCNMTFVVAPTFNANAPINVIEIGEVLRSLQEEPILGWLRWYCWHKWQADTGRSRPHPPPRPFISPVSTSLQKYDTFYDMFKDRQIQYEEPWSIFGDWPIKYS